MIFKAAKLPLPTHMPAMENLSILVWCPLDWVMHEYLSVKQTYLPLSWSYKLVLPFLLCWAFVSHIFLGEKGIKILNFQGNSKWYLAFAQIRLLTCPIKASCNKGYKLSRCSLAKGIYHYNLHIFTPFNYYQVIYWVTSIFCPFWPTLNN